MLNQRSISRFLNKIGYFITTDACKQVETPSFWLLSFLLIRILGCVYFVVADGRGMLPLEPATYSLAGTDGYIQLAKTWLDTGSYAFHPDGLPVHTRPPVTPFLMKYLAAPFTKHWYIAWFSITTMLFWLTACVFFKIIQQNISNVLIRRLILAAFLLFPPFVVVVRAATFLPIGTMLVMVWAFSNILSFNQKRYYYFLGWGILAALAALTHATLVLLLPASLLGIWLHSKELRRKIVAGVLFLTAFGATVFPWTLRNYHTFGQLIPVASGAGAQYWKGEESVFGTTDIIFKVYQQKFHQKLVVNYFSTETPQQDDELWQLAVADMKRYPAKAALRVLRGGFQFWFPNDSVPAKRIFLLLLNTPWVVWWIVRWRAIFRRAVLRPLLSFCFLMWLTFAFFGAEASYYVMLLPLLWLQIALSYEKCSHEVAPENITMEIASPKTPPKNKN